MPPLPGSRGPASQIVDVVVPVHDQETDLEPCVRRLHARRADLGGPAGRAPARRRRVLHDLSRPAG